MSKASAFQRDVYRALEEVALNAVEHVGVANYAGRESEARSWVRRACELAGNGASGDTIRRTALLAQEGQGNE